LAQDWARAPIGRDVRGRMFTGEARSSEENMDHVSFQSRTWGGLVLRGLVAILFGVLAFARPGTTAAALVYVFGAFAILDGIFALVASWRVAQLRGNWVGLMLVGLLGIVIGILTYVEPAATAVGLIYYVAAWALLTGIFEVAAAVRLRKVIEGEWILAVAGLLSIAFALMLAARPRAGMVSIVWFIGAYAIIFGALEIGLAIRLRGASRPLVTA
jgi:uncharacterized membrane protein HdeD (DUF308 family)